MTIRKPYRIIMLLSLALLTTVFLSIETAYAAFDFKDNPRDSDPFTYSSTNLGLYKNAANYHECTCNQPIDSAVSSDESVVIVNTGNPYQFYDDSDYANDIDQIDLGQECNACQIIPVGPGTAVITLKSGSETLTKTVTVEAGYFAAYLKAKSQIYNGLPGFMDVRYDHSGEPYEAGSIIMGYGETKRLVYSRYGTKVKLTLKGKTYTGTTGKYNSVVLNKIKSKYKLGTKGKLTLKYGPASSTRTIKVGSITRIYLVYNKYKQKLGSYTYKVGQDVDEEDL